MVVPGRERVGYRADDRLRASERATAQQVDI